MSIFTPISQIPPQDRGPLLFWLGVLMVIVVVAGIGIMLLRRKLCDKDITDTPADAGFSLAGLREMRDRGEITDEEYQRARDKVVTKVKSTLAPPPEKSGPDNSFGGPAGGQKPR